ncbi:hypothetical protein H7I94_11965, partial [Mycobacterium szulgai]|nr:hypothetical protein [Mycobacterium szulgai]
MPRAARRADPRTAALVTQQWTPAVGGTQRVSASIASATTPVPTTSTTPGLPSSAPACAITPSPVIVTRSTPSEVSSASPSARAASGAFNAPAAPTITSSTGPNCLATNKIAACAHALRPVPRAPARLAPPPSGRIPRP